MLIFKDCNITKNFTVSEYCTGQKDDCYFSDKSLVHCLMLQELRNWLKKPLFVTSWYRSYLFNAKCGGAKNSNHLKGTATDVYFHGLTEKKFISVAKKWKSICKKYGVVGEIGFYPDDGFIHLGSHITYSNSFYNWRTKDGNQINGYYNSKI